MLKKWNDLLAGVPMTLVGAVFLILSFVLPRMGIDFFIDPAWIQLLSVGYHFFI